MSTFIATLQQAFDWTWRTSVQASVLIMLVLLLQRFLRRWLTPRLRYALSLLVLCRLLLPVAPSSSLSLENLLAPTPQMTRSGPPTTLVAGAAAEPGTSIRAHGLTLGSAFCVTWFCGLLLLGGLAAWRFRHWRLRVRTARPVSDEGLFRILDEVRHEVGIRRPVRLASLAYLGSPAVFGFWRLHLLLPETSLNRLSHKEWHLVFLHEMTHIRNCDTILNAVLIAVQFLHWFNPLVWISFRRLRTDRELVCDARVVERLEPNERLGYAQVLLKLVEALSNGPRAFPSALPVVSSVNEIKTRVTMIKHYRQASRRLSAGIVLCILLLGALTFTRAREGEIPTERDGTPSHLSGETQSGVENTVIQEFKTAGYVLPESVLDDLVQETINKEYGNRSAFAKALQKRGMTIKEYREEIRERFMAQLAITNSATIDQRALGFDWYLGNLLMTTGRAEFPFKEMATIAGGTNGTLVKYGPTTIRADRLTVDPQQGRIVAEGHVVVNQEEKGRQADRLPRNAATNQGPSQQKVGAIEIRYVGPKSVPETEVRRRIRAQVDKPFNTEDIDEDVRNLYATGLFYNVRVSTVFSLEGLDLTYIVQCNPRLAKLSFTGNSKLSDAQLQKLIQAKVGDLCNERKLFSDTEAIQKAYERAGYQSPGVKYSYGIDEQTGEASVTFEIKEKK